MKILILGDCHGEWGILNVVIARAIQKYPDITHIIQCGDFGYGWPGIKPFKASRGFFTDEQLAVYNAAEKMWLDGNHENFDQLESDEGKWQPGWTHKKRGEVLEIENLRLLFFGGATSIDKAQRIEGKSWWPQETIKYGEVQKTLLDENRSIDAIFSHDFPSSFPYKAGKYKQEVQGDRNMLNALLEKYQPKLWFFGHHHTFDTNITNGTNWYCCPIIDSLHYLIWDLDIDTIIYE